MELDIFEHFILLQSIFFYLFLFNFVLIFSNSTPNLQTQLNFSWTEFSPITRRRMEGRNNPHLASTRGNGPISLNSDGLPVGV